jgi:hypothetical protein
MPQVPIQPQKISQIMIQSGSLLKKPSAALINSDEGNKSTGANQLLDGFSAFLHPGFFRAVACSRRLRLSA